MRHILRKIVLVVMLLLMGSAPLFVPDSVSAANLAVRIQNAAQEVVGGDRLYFDVDMDYPENTIDKTVTLEYQIFDGEDLILSEKSERGIGKRISFTDYMIVPTSVTSGTKTLIITVHGSSSGLEEVASGTFRVLKGRDQITLYGWIILVASIPATVLLIVQIIFMRIKAHKKPVPLPVQTEVMK